MTPIIPSTSVLPIEFGEDKTAAVPVVNNVALTSKGSYYDLTGDITNTGITDAKGLTVTVGSPAKGTGTYPEYAIGSLASDDSGSFEADIHLHGPLGDPPCDPLERR